MNSNSEIRQTIAEMGYEDTLFLDPDYLDEAIIGLTHDGRVAYDYDKLVAAFVTHDNMDAEAATEWIEYNTIRSLPYYSQAPVIIYNLDNLNG